MPAMPIRMNSSWQSADVLAELQAVLTCCSELADQGTELQPIVLGGSRDGSRVVLAIMLDGEARPRWIAKLATGSSEGALLTREFEVLRSVLACSPARITDHMPRPIALERRANLTALLMTAKPGRRPLLPRLTQRGTAASRHVLRAYIRRTLQWSSVLAESARSDTVATRPMAELIDRFETTLDAAPDVRACVQGFRQAVESSECSFAPCWQHGDLTTGNVLTHRRSLQVVDWAHASDSYEPWFDAAYAPGSLALMAWAERPREGVRSAVLATLSEESWTGRTLRSELECNWNHPIPLAWATTLASMRASLRHGQAEERGWPPWRALAVVLLADNEVRSRVSWLAPRW